jgi:hypothetical protein
MMSLIHILNNYHDPFPHLKGRGGLQFHPSRRIIGGALSNQLAQQQITDMIAQIKETEFPEKLDYPNVDDYIEKIENKLQASEPEPEPEQYLTNEEIKDNKISKYNNKDKLEKLAKSMKLPIDGTNKEIKERIKERIEKANEKPVEKVVEKPKDKISKKTEDYDEKEIRKAKANEPKKLELIAKKLIEVNKKIKRENETDHIVASESDEKEIRKSITETKESLNTVFSKLPIFVEKTNELLKKLEELIDIIEEKEPSSDDEDTPNTKALQENIVDNVDKFKHYVDTNQIKLSGKDINQLEGAKSQIKKFMEIIYNDKAEAKMPKYLKLCKETLLKIDGIFAKNTQNIKDVEDAKQKQTLKVIKSKTKEAEDKAELLKREEDIKEKVIQAREAKRAEKLKQEAIEKAQEQAKEEERLEKIRIKQEQKDKADKFYKDTLMKKALKGIKAEAKESMIPKINAKIPLVEDALRQRQETKPYLSLSPESILKLATRLYKKKTLQPWQVLSDYQMNQQGIYFTIDEPLKREYDIQKSNYEYMSTNIIPYVKKLGMQNVEYGIGYENWLSKYGQSLMKKITGTTSDIKNSKEHTNIVGDVKAYYVYDYFNDESELEVKYYHRPEDSYFKLLKDDTKGYPFQKSKFIGGDNSKGSFKPYFIMDNGRLKLYNILQTYVAPDGSIEKIWINNKINKEVYFSVCCADTIIYLNMNDDLVLRINSVSNPQIYDKNGKKIKNAPSILKQIDIEGMITHGDVLKDDDKWIQIQAKKFKQVENI